MNADDPQNPPPSESGHESEAPAGGDETSAGAAPPVAGDETPAGSLPPAGGDEAPAGVLPPADGMSPAGASPPQADSAPSNVDDTSPPPAPESAPVPITPPPADSKAADLDTTLSGDGAGGSSGDGGDGAGDSPPPPQSWTRSLLPIALVLLAIGLAFAAVSTAVKYEDIDQNVECDVDRQTFLDNPIPGQTAPQCADDGAVDDKDERWMWLGLAVISGVLALVFLVWAGSVGWRLLHPNVEAGELGLGAMILSSAALLIGLAALLTVVVYVLPVRSNNYDDWRAYAAVITGIAAALLFATLRAILQRDPASARQSQSRVFDVLNERWGALNARVDLLCDDQANSSIFSHQSLGLEARAGCEEAKVHRCQMAAALGIWKEAKCIKGAKCIDSETKQPPDHGAKWIIGTGYMELWNRLHNAEEAVLVVSTREQAVAAALFDETRLYGSNIENWDKLLERLRRAIRVLGGQDYLSSEVNKVLDDVTTWKDDTPQAAQARLVIRDVRHAINQFRDKSREALVRARNQLMWTGMLTGVAAFTILVLAILSGAPRRTILSASVFFLCGAVVGLFDQLRSSGESVSSEEDYGLGRARLVYTPYISGLAAVGGVLVTAMLYATVNGSVLKYQPPPTALPTATVTTSGQDDDSALVVSASPESGATTTTVPEAARIQLDPPPLSLVFDLDDNRFGLVMAAIFGLTPSLLISRLQGEANRYKADLQSTSGQERSK